METKEVATSGKITQELIGGWFLYGIIYGIVYTIISNIVIVAVKSTIAKAIIVIILQGITVFLVWHSSIASTFKKRTMDYNDVNIVMKNLTIFTIIVCIINGLYNYSKVDKAINTTFNSNTELKVAEWKMSYIYDEDQMSEYQKLKEEKIKETKKQLYIYLTLLEVGLTAVYLIVLPLEKKEILKYIEE